jgi:hypothetical protein
VVFDVVHNHAGGFSVNGNLDDACIYNWDRTVNSGNNNHRRHFSDQGPGTGGLSFTLWNNDVRDFIINTTRHYIDEFHADDFRYDQISDLISMNCDSGWSFCRDLANTDSMFLSTTVCTARSAPPWSLPLPASSRCGCYASGDPWYKYSVGFPGSGPWTEIFNSDVYDNLINPIVAGNFRGIIASDAHETAYLRP